MYQSLRPCAFLLCRQTYKFEKLSIAQHSGDSIPKILLSTWAKSCCVSFLGCPNSVTTKTSSRTFTPKKKKKKGQWRKKKKTKTFTPNPKSVTRRNRDEYWTLSQLIQHSLRSAPGRSSAGGKPRLTLQHQRTSSNNYRSHCIGCHIPGLSKTQPSVPPSNVWRESLHRQGEEAVNVGLPLNL